MVARRRYMYEWGLVLALLSLVLGGVGSEATTGDRGYAAACMELGATRDLGNE